MTTWRSDAPPPVAAIPLWAWPIALLRGVLLFGVTLGGLTLLLALRLVERPLAGQNRPVTPYITQSVCQTAFWIMGIGYKVRGAPMKHMGALVANHGSWLDIFALNACQRVYFVSKAEVANWPLIGWLARATGTVFIERDPRRAKAQTLLFEARIHAGHKLLFFPEGTSTDTRRVLPFKSTLFAAFQSDDLRDVMQIQPVSVIYQAPKGASLSFYGWWGDMQLGPHMVRVWGKIRQGTITLVFHDPVAVAGFATRKELASHCETVIRESLDHALGATPD
ncbi:MAG: lysophospholipid acyltransferase family protein [Albidovulum sp.]